MKFIKKYKIYIILLSIILLLSIGGTIAWYVWTSTDNSYVSLEVCAPEISFIGGDTINGTNLVPVSSKEQGLKKQIDVFLNKTCKEGDSGVMNLYMKLDSLPEALQQETFIYEVVKDDEVLYSGNFKDNKEGDVITLLTDEIITETSSVYTIYAYIDGTRSNPIEMSNKTFRFSVYGEGTGAIYRENVLTNTTANSTYFLNTNIQRNKIKTLTTTDSNKVPEGITGIDISSTGDESIMLWSIDDDNDGMLDVYIGSENGTIKANITGQKMFAYLRNVEYLDLSNLDTSNITNMFAMFKENDNLKEIKLSNFDTSNVTNMSLMFHLCTSLTSLDLSNFDTSRVIYMNSMFDFCTSLKALYLSHFDVSNVTNMAYMFNGCSSLTILDLSNWITSSATNMASMFWSCSSLTSLDLSSFDTSNVTDMTAMFYNCRSIISLDLSNFDTSKVMYICDTRFGMFEECTSLEILDLSGFDTSNVELMKKMFYRCRSLKSINFGNNFTNKKVKDMSGLFEECESLETLDLSKFKTSAVTYMRAMFRKCSSLVTLDLSNFDTSNVIDMSLMFHLCTSLTSLDLSNFDTSRVIYMNSMFDYCTSLKALYLSHFDVSNVTNMAYMFKGCSSLTSLDLSNWSTSGVTNMDAMFRTCSKLSTIYVSSFWDVTNVTSSSGMFWECNSLTGSSGTTYNKNYTGATYARIDGGVDNPGYLTLKTV